MGRRCGAGLIDARGRARTIPGMRFEHAPGSAFRPVPAVEIECGGWLLTRLHNDRTRDWHRVVAVTRPYPNAVHVRLARPNGQGGGTVVFGVYEAVIYRSERPQTPSPSGEVRAAVRAAFPYTRFTVRPMVDGASVSWTDGPTPREVVEVIKAVESCWRWAVHRRVTDAEEALMIAREALGGQSAPDWPYGYWEHQPRVTDPTPGEHTLAVALLRTAATRRVSTALDTLLREVGIDALMT